MPKDEVLSVKIISPQETIFDGIATSISSTNSQGKFDILPKHANFITLIQNQPIIVRRINKNPLIFNFSLAIIYTLNNRVSIYTDILLK